MEELASLAVYFVVVVLGFFFPTRRSMEQYSKNKQNPTTAEPPQTQKLVNLDSRQLFQGHLGVKNIFFIMSIQKFFPSNEQT